MLARVRRVVVGGELSGLLRAAVHVVELEDQPAATPQRGDGEIADGITLSALLLAGLGN